MPSQLRSYIRLGQTLAVLLLLLCPAAGLAAVDLSGPWVITFYLFPISFPALFAQNGTALDVTFQVGDGGTGSGTIDPDSGAFNLTGSYVVRPGIPEAPPVVTCHFVWTAFATIDGQGIAGTHSDDCGVRTAVGGIRQTCGNGVLDPGETCDAALPCCTPSCQLAPIGTACPDDGNQCTDDRCDADGLCQHTPNSAPCSATGCTADVCAGGACVPGDALPAGTACPDDGSPCTSEACDGAGGCRHEPLPEGTPCADDTTSCQVHSCDAAGQCQGVPRRCPACQTCATGQCFTTPSLFCANATVRSVLDLRGPNAAPRLDWTWTGLPPSIPLPANFADPRSAAQYSLCLYTVSADRTTTAGTTIPPGGACAGSPCWSEVGNAFVYANPGDAAGTGIRRMRLYDHGLHRIHVRGEGPILGLPRSLRLSSVLVQLVKEGGSFPVCWQSEFTAPLMSTRTHFRARR